MIDKFHNDSQMSRVSVGVNMVPPAEVGCRIQPGRSAKYLQYQGFSWGGAVAVDDGCHGGGQVVAALKNLSRLVTVGWGGQAG